VIGERGHGVEPEVFFEQVAVPGREAAIDFTHATDLGVTIAGDPFPHLLFEFVLSYSHWTWVAIAFGETFEALAAGVQGALWALGGVPAVLAQRQFVRRHPRAESEPVDGSDAALSEPCSSTTACARVGSRPAGRMKTASPSKRIAA